MRSIKQRGFRLLAVILVLQSCIALGKNEYVEVSEPIATTSSGQVKGKYVRTTEGKDAAAFTGIPFAEPPIGESRFKKPVPVKHWQGIYDATRKPPHCMQLIDKDLPWIPEGEPSEDCLFLNIWVPGKCRKCADAHPEKLPVMVWIHGGGYYSGTSADDLYDGAIFATTGNVIIATMNYRLGSFGFLSCGNEDAPGNMGLLDQTLALKWIKENIANFGGDPKNITLFGESVGAISVGLLMISPLSRNLFDKAIMQSESPYHPGFTTSQAVAKVKGNMIAASVGCSNSTANLQTQPQKVVKCLRGKDPKELARTENAILKEVPLFFLPIYGDSLIPQAPVEALEAGNFRDIPVLMGNNKDEGSVFMYSLFPEYFQPEAAANLSIAQAKMVIMDLFQNNTQPPPNVIADYYLNNVTENNQEVIVKRIYDSFGDNVFVCPTMFFAEKMKDAFFYFFTHRPSNTRWGNWMGVTHFEDVAFVFGAPLKSPESYTPEEVEFSRNIIRKWSSFAKTGTPCSGDCTNSWPKYTSSTHQYKELNPRSFQIGTGPHLESCNFWRQYFKNQK